MKTITLVLPAATGPRHLFISELSLALVTAYHFFILMKERKDVTFQQMMQHAFMFGNGPYSIFDLQTAVEKNESLMREFIQEKDALLVIETSFKEIPLKVGEASTIESLVSQYMTNGGFVKNPLTEAVACLHCEQMPGFLKQVLDADQVYHALECNCKMTPYMRSMTLVEVEWGSTTFKLEPKVAYEKAVKESPSEIAIRVPQYAR